MKIACIGAGPAGLYLALLMKLRDPNNDVTVYERNAVDVVHGWGVVFWEDLLDNLRENDPHSAREILAHAFYWTDQVIDIRGKKVRGGGGGFAICRRQLLAILINRARELGVNIRFGHELGELDPLPDADLIVASDGVGSQVRRRGAHHFGTRVSVGRNKYVWLGTTKVFGAFTFGFVQTAAGWLWFHAYAYNSETSTFIIECSPETWTALGFHTLGADESLAALETIFAHHLDGNPLVSRGCKGKGLPWLSFRDTRNETWHMGKIALVGDAAHTTHFSIGSGTRLAIQDAIALADALSEHKNVETALRAYESHRKRAIALPAADARLSAQWFENVPRYAALEAHQLFRLLMDRRSRIMPYVSPKLYCWVRGIPRTKGIRKLYRWSSTFTESLAATFHRLTEKTVVAAKQIAAKVQAL